MKLLLGSAALALAISASTQQAPVLHLPESLPDTSGAVAFVDVNVVTMLQDGVAEHMTVVTRRGVIEQIGRAGDVPLGAEVVRIDGRGRYLMPGLADMHTHLRYPDDLLGYLAHGVTTVLNLSQPVDHPTGEMQRRIEGGSLIGPTLFASGIRIDGDAGRPITPGLVRNAAEARAEVRRQRAAGAQLIKAYSFLSADAYRALVAEAKLLGITVVGHVPHSVGVLETLRLGQRAIVHAEEYLIGPDGAPNDSTGAPSTAPRRELDESRIDEMVAATKRAGAFVIPTLSTTENIAAQWGRPTARDSMLRLADVPLAHPQWQSSWRRDERYITRAEPFAARVAFQRKVVSALFQAGVPLMLGTDSPSNPVMPPGSSLLNDMAALMRAGVPLPDVLRAGTRNASDFLTSAVPGTRPFGVVAAGAEANLVLLRENPLEHIQALQSLEGTMARGRWLSAKHLLELRTQRAREVSDPSPHTIRQIRVRRDVTLEVLDWGGAGPPLVLLAGLGDTPHSMDEWAPRFRDSFRVVGITRRGWGGSSRWNAPITMEQLAEDIRVALDSLGIARARFAGHSFGGNELVALASKHASLVQAAVYLDGAYDRTNVKALFDKAPPPPFPEPTRDDSATIANMKAFQDRTFVRVPLSEWRTLLRVDALDRVLGPVTSTEALEHFLRAMEAPTYRDVHVPALAIYSFADSLHQALPFTRVMSHADSVIGMRHLAAAQRWVRGQVARYQRETPNASVRLIHGAHHYVFISHPDEVERAMRAFFRTH